MSARATWKGVLQISLVRIPIKVFPATESSESISFNQLHAVCQTRVTQKRWCATCEREVPNSEIVKGYEFASGQYVVLVPDELDAVQPPSTKVIDLTRFAEFAQLDPLYVIQSYYLAPDGPQAAEAFVVLRDAMRDQVGIGKLAIYGREYLVAVRPYAYTLVLHTVHHTAEIRPLDVEDLGIAPSWVPAAAPSKLAKQMIAAMHGPLALEDFSDQYQADLRQLIDAKIAGKEIVEPPAVAPGAVLTLTDALTQSLVAVTKAKKIPAKATLPKQTRRA